MDALLAKNFTKNSYLESNKPIQVKARTVRCSVNLNQNGSIEVHNRKCTSTAKTEVKSVALGSNQDPGVWVL